MREEKSGKVESWCETAMASLARFFRSLISVTPPVPVTVCRSKIEAYKLTTDELLKRMPKEEAINFVQNVLRTMESSNAPDSPATKIRMEELLEELKRS